MSTIIDWEDDGSPIFLVLNTHQEFKQHWSSCKACELCKERKQVVIGEGDMPCDVMFIGEAPGKSEDFTGIPFYGTSGKLLHSAMDWAGADKIKTYVTNIVGCRPPENRDPRKDEIRACASRLRGLAEYCQPKVVVTLGTVAKVNTRWWKGQTLHLLHPAYILRQGGLVSTEYIRFKKEIRDLVAEIIKGGNSVQN